MRYDYFTVLDDSWQRFGSYGYAATGGGLFVVLRPVVRRMQNPAQQWHVAIRADLAHGLPLNGELFGRYLSGDQAAAFAAARPEDFCSGL